MKLFKTICSILICISLFAGCKSAVPVETDPLPLDTQVSDYFSQRDLSGSYDAENCAVIELTGNSANCSSDAVKIEGSTVWICDEGSYLLRGQLSDGMIIVDADKEDKTQLILQDVSIHCESSAPIYIRQADKIFITLCEDTANQLSCGNSYIPIDENNIDSVIFSKEDLCLNGGGSLTISSPAGHGVVSKDELTLAGGGNYSISCAGHGLSAKDNLCIERISLTVSAGKDGMKAENEEDSSLGYVYIQDGTYNIACDGDGISASGTLTVSDGSFEITSGGGSVNAADKPSEQWGHMGGPGGRGDFSGATESTEDSTSSKGIKSAGAMLLSGGKYTLDTADDAIHSNADLTVAGGEFTIQTGDDGFHADEALTVNAGMIQIEKSYEGLEGLCIDIKGGEILLTASDDGLNAAGGTDQSGFGGMRGGDRFGGMGGGNADSYIHISGGSLKINASGDGIDSNGTFLISDGSVTVCGPTRGDTSVLDYEISGTITGGTFLGSGAYQMAQTFSDSEQGVIAVSVGNQTAGTQCTLTDAKGNAVISFCPDIDYAIVILSSPALIKGETYTITVGDASGSFNAN